jgi:hypothetical protein
VSIGRASTFEAYDSRISPRPRCDTATPMAPWRRVARLLVLSSLVVGCKRKDGTELVVGVQSEPMGGVLSSLHIVVEVGGVVTSDEIVKPLHSSLVGFPPPWEKRIAATGDVAAPIEVTVEAFGSASPSGAPMLSRLAKTRFVEGRTALLRVPLESRCLVYPPAQRRRGAAPGPLSGPTCKAPLTCIKGLCQPEVVQPAALEPYTADWTKNAPDLCKARNSGVSTVQIGTGQTGFTPLATGQTLQAEAGPQGGHHIWIAVRMKNMKQAGSTTQISAVQPDTGTVIPPSTFAFTFDRDEGGYCKLFGLRYQLDNGGIDYTQFLGKSLDVTTIVTDSLGEKATSSAHIQIAPTLVNP